ncbi:MAG: phage holin, LLH family [Erysipelotrichales bacterium]|nr:phage holin, LLH family [Erysipelotrichales bacterium]
MEDIEIILSLAATALTCLLAALTCFFKLLRAVKNKKKAENFIKIEEALLPFIEEAEKFTQFSGAEKKAYVLMRIAEVTAKQRIKLSTDEVSKKIDGLVSLSRNVNVSNERALARDNSDENCYIKKSNKELSALKN